MGPACLASGSESGHVRGGVAVGGAGAPGAPVGLGGGAPWRQTGVLSNMEESLHKFQGFFLCVTPFSPVLSATDF